MKISIIIPTLNEAETLPKLLPALDARADELIVADGGSTDGTCEVARRFSARVVQSAAGRAVQMNHGAEAATGEIFWFLHADSVVPPDWRNWILKALAETSVVGGGFRVTIDAKGARYRFLDCWGWLRTQFRRSFYGDQGIFVRREIFQKLGGFSLGDLPEDIDFSTRMSRLGKVAILDPPIKTSARRWERHGFWRTVLFHSGIALSYGARRGKGWIAVVVIAKAPVPGQVKTRLVPPLTPQEAADLAKRLLLEMVERVVRLKGVRPMVAVAPAEALGQMRKIIPQPVFLLAQSNGNLGERLRRIFEELFAKSCRGVIVVGADHPNLPDDYLRQAVAVLEDPRDRLVLGPTEDGGYYLIGLNQHHPELFQGVPWSTAEVLAATQKQARELNLTLHLLPAWYDIDRPEDLARLR